MFASLLPALLVCVATAAAVSYENYHAIVAGPLKTRKQLEVIDLLRDEDTRTRKVSDRPAARRGHAHQEGR